MTNKTQKGTFIVIFVVFFFSSYLRSQNIFWHYIPVNPINTITSIYFYDSLRGFYVTTGMNPNIGRTNNGGAEWNRISLGNEVLSLYSVFFINERIGWAVGEYNIIRKTIDEGISWQIQDNGSQISNLTVHFSDTINGIIGGYNTRASILKTTNGGANWFNVYSSILPYSEVRCQHWLNHDTGWIAGNDVLLKTTDCGNTYQNFYGYFPPSSNGSNAILDIYFVNEFTGWACGLNIDQKNLFKTTNGGYDWIYQPNPVQLEGYTRQINGIKFINENTGWAAASALMIIKTTNGGTNWNIDLTNNVMNEYYSIEKNLKSRVWAGASSGGLWYRDSLHTIYATNISSVIPNEYKLYQNFPNPFNPMTRIRFEIASSENNKNVFFKKKIELIVYDLLGRQVSSLVKDNLKPGTYEVEFNSSYLPSGVYIYALFVSNNRIDAKKMIIVK